MSRSIWATALAASAMALALFTAALLPSVALAAGGSSADNAHSQTHRAAVLEPGSGFPTPSRAVRSLQTKLTANGFSPGPVDGRFGPLTRAAVAAFPAGGRARRRRDRRPPYPSRAHRRRLAAGRGLDRAHGLSRGQGAAAAPASAPGSRPARSTAVTALARWQRSSASSTRITSRQRDRLRSDPPGAREPHPQARAAPAPRPSSPAPEAEGQAQPGPGQSAAGAHHTNPAPAPAQPVVHKPSSFPWTILLLLGALAVGALAILALRGRKPDGACRRSRPQHPQVYETLTGETPTVPDRTRSRLRR